ncbi:ABC-type multidrug transport system fused ATPase/permease subunit [Arthrobacter sp. UYEF6]
MQLMTGADPTSGALGYVSRLVGTTDTQPLIMSVALAVGAAFALKSIVTMVFRWWLLGHTTRLEAEAAAELMRRYVMAPYWAHRERKVSVINRNIGTSVSQTFGQVVLGLISTMADVLTLIGVSAVLMAVSPLATIFTIILFSLLGWGLQLALRKRHLQVGQSIAQSDLDAWGSLMPGLQGFRESRLASSTDVFVSRFRKAKSARAQAIRLMTMLYELPKYVLELGFVVGIAGITSVLFATSSPESALSVLGVFAAASVRLLPTINRVVATAGSVRSGQVGMQILVRELEELDANGYHSDEPASSERFQGDVVFDKVSYSYPGSETEVLRSISVTIAQGKTTAFVGSSGAGKSTLLDILLGLLEPTSGTISCGGRNILDDTPTWHAGLSVVPQDVYLLDDSLEQNIAFGKATGQVDSERLSEAIALAQLTAVVEELPEGVATRMGERGVRLSGGQRQRLGIARAMYRRPDVLVLDEATSALDNETERKISETIDSLSGSITIAIVAHRLSTVKNADKIVFMSDGTVEAEGSFDEVQMNSPEFARLVALGKLG